MYKYLQEENYYNDRYDLWTIEMCLRSGNKLELHFIKGNRYEERASTIRAWMEEDRKLDNKLDNTHEPKGIYCQVCSARMESILKQFMGISEPLRVLFMFECHSCHKREAFWEDGKPWIYDPEHCQKCNKEIETIYSKKGNIVTWTRSCLSCGFKEIETEDVKKKSAERLKEERRKQALLDKHRAEFCLSEKEGQEYVEWIRRLEYLSATLEGMERKQPDPVYQEVIKLKKIKIIELEQLLSQELEKHKYIKLVFNKPEVSKHIIVPFNTQDADPLRKEYESIHKLQRVIRKTLKGTNWCLMSDGVCHKLGYLWGRLKGYDKEEDLVQVVKQNKNIKTEIS